MWNDIRALNIITRAMLGVVLLALLFAGYKWIARQDMFDLRVVQVRAADGGPLRYVDAAVLSSPALGATPNALQKLLLATLPKLLPHLCVDNGLNADLVARDAQVVQAYKADPLVHRRISAGLAAWILAQGQRTVAEAAQWTVPTLQIGRAHV